MPPCMPHFVNFVGSSGHTVQECCDRVFLSARGAIEENQGGLLGIYNYTGVHNERPYYAKRFHNDTYYLFYKTESK